MLLNRVAALDLSIWGVQIHAGQSLTRSDRRWFGRIEIELDAIIFFSFLCLDPRSERANLAVLTHDCLLADRYLCEGLRLLALAGHLHAVAGAVSHTLEHAVATHVARILEY